MRGKLVPPPAHPLGPLLLAWLALHPGDHSRGEVAALLSPGIAESNARAALRRAAWAVRRALGPCERELRDDRTTIGLRCTTDLHAFEARLAAGDVEAALALCRGALLDGLDEQAWVLAAREHHAARVAAARAQLARG